MKKLLLSILAIAGINSISFSQCNDLIISKYCSMGANNKCIEIYNTTSNPIVLDNVYQLARYKTPTASGSVSGVVPSFPNFSDTLHLKGTIAPYSAFVICNPETTPNTSNSGAICNPALQAHADQLGNIYGTYGSSVGDPTYFKGSDAITLEKKVGNNNVIVDMLGRFGDFMAASNGSASAWSSVAPYTGGTGMGVWLTKGYMLVRKSNVTSGVTTNPSAFNTLAEYDSIAKPKTLADTLNIWNLLGTHSCLCSVGINEVNSEGSIRVFPNPVSDGNSIQLVSVGLIQEISVFSIEGKILYNAKMEQPSFKSEIPTNKLSKGVYFISVLHSNGKSATQRIIKE
jgi:Secretion system C-terminal sorting domain/Lamin Tail Domain